MDMSILEWARTGMNLGGYCRLAVIKAAHNVTESAFKKALDEVLANNEEQQGDYVTQTDALDALRRCGVLA
jgi:hypothetical protein